MLAEPLAHVGAEAVVERMQRRNENIDLVGDGVELNTLVSVRHWAARAGPLTLFADNVLICCYHRVMYDRAGSPLLRGGAISAAPAAQRGLGLWEGLGAGRVATRTSRGLDHVVDS